MLAVTGCVWVLILQMGRQQGRRGKSRGCLSCGLTWGSCISCGMDGTKPYVSSPSSPKAQKCPLGATQDLGGSRGMLENELCCTYCGCLRFHPLGKRWKGFQTVRAGLWENCISTGKNGLYFMENNTQRHHTRVVQCKTVSIGKIL